MPTPPRGRPRLGDPVAEERGPHPLEADEGHEAERGREADGVGELAADAHRRRRVDQEVHAEVLLVEKQFDVQPLEPTEDVPVDIA